MPALACTICGRRSFVALRLEIPAGAVTYLVCPRKACIDEAFRRARENLYNAARSAAAEPALLDGATIEARATEVDSGAGGAA